MLMRTNPVTNDEDDEVLPLFDSTCEGENCEFEAGTSSIETKIIRIYEYCEKGFST